VSVAQHQIADTRFAKTMTDDNTHARRIAEQLRMLEEEEQEDNNGEE